MQTMDSQDHTILTEIHNGMEVYARDGQKVGKVTLVIFGQENPSTLGVDTVGVDNRDPMGGNIIEDIARAFNPNDVPEVVRARLLRRGFIRVDPGLLASDRYIITDQIAGVKGDRVELNINKDELISW